MAEIVCEKCFLIGLLWSSWIQAKRSSLAQHLYMTTSSRIFVDGICKILSRRDEAKDNSPLLATSIVRGNDLIQEPQFLSSCRKVTVSTSFRDFSETIFLPNKIAGEATVKVDHQRHHFSDGTVPVSIKLGHISLTPKFWRLRATY